MNWVWGIFGIAFGFFLGLAFQRFRENFRKGPDMIIRVQRVENNRAILEKVKVLGGWENEGQAIASAIAFYHWALEMEVKGRFWFWPPEGGKGSPIRVLKNEE
jgi:hypothetical protein